MEKHHIEIRRIFEELWRDYVQLNPNVMKIHDLIEAEGGAIVNDHIAFRTFGVEGFRVDDLAQHFLALGYSYGEDYHFEAKKLKAKHLNAPNPMLPKVFISELMIEQCSKDLQAVVTALLDQVDKSNFLTPDFLWQGRRWNPISYEVYDALRQESEYAAWMYVFGTSFVITSRLS